MSILSETPYNAFLNHLRVEKRSSQHTIVAYEGDLKKFESFLIETFEISELRQVKPTHIRSWLASLKVEDKTARTINRKISSLKSFYKFCLKRGLVSESPMAAIISPKSTVKLPQFLDVKDANIIFQNVLFADDYTGRLDELILKLLYVTGIRQAELLGLKDEDINFSGSTIKVLGKGSKERMIPISAAMLNGIEVFQSLKKQLGISCAGNHMLCTEKGKPLYQKLLYNIVHSYLSKITTIDKKSPHVLRHSFATHLSNSGADINAIKDLLGHASLAATQVYLHNNIEQLKDVYKKAHPKA
jgi:integrase/recombinase XerC